MAKNNKNVSRNNVFFLLWTLLPIKIQIIAVSMNRKCVSDPCIIYCVERNRLAKASVYCIRMIPHEFWECLETLCRYCLSKSFSYSLVLFFSFNEAYLYQQQLRMQQVTKASFACIINFAELLFLHTPACCFSEKEHQLDFWFFAFSRNCNCWRFHIIFNPVEVI